MDAAPPAKARRRGLYPAADPVAPPDDIPDVEPDEPPTWRDRLRERFPVLDADTLSKREAKGARDDVINAILKYAEFADEAIPMLSRTHAPVVIWSNLNDVEAAALADFLLAQGQRWAPVAVVVRGIVATYSYLELGFITVPRFRGTIRYYIANGFVLSLNMRIGQRQRGVPVTAEAGR